MLALISSVLCLLHLALAFLNYKRKDYKTSMLQMFVAGFCFSVVICIRIMRPEMDWLIMVDK